MEEKRSIHSLRSAAGRAAHLQQNRPMSDISFIDEEGNPVSTPASSAATATGTNGLRTGNVYYPQQRHYRQLPVDQYLKVEGHTYRVQQQRVHQQPVQPAPLAVAAPSAATTAAVAATPTATRIRRCSDAQTQSCESSFDALTSSSAQHPAAPLLTASSTTTTTNKPNCDSGTSMDSPCVQQQQVGGQGLQQQHRAPSHVTHSPPPAFAVPPSSYSSRDPSPIPPPPSSAAVIVAAAAPPSPSPMIQAAYGYDPSYCQYLGQAADGYQYELVRRPSLGNPLATAAPPPPPPPPQSAAELSVPNHVLRRPSTGSPYPLPSDSHSPHQQSTVSLGQATSLQGSFDSGAGVVPTTLLIQNPVPSPYHVVYQPPAQAYHQPQLLPSPRMPQLHPQVSPRHMQPGGGPGSAMGSMGNIGGGIGGGGGIQSAFRVVKDHHHHVEATSSAAAVASELQPMPKMIHETSI